MPLPDPLPPYALLKTSRSNRSKLTAAEEPFGGGQVVAEIERTSSDLSMKWAISHGQASDSFGRLQSAASGKPQFAATPYEVKVQPQPSPNANAGGERERGSPASAKFDQVTLRRR